MNRWNNQILTYNLTLSREVVSLPAIVGIVQVNSIGSSGVFHIGDVYQIAPSSTAKTYSGSGSFNTGEKLYVYNNRSNTNTYDKDVQDQGNILNV